MGDLEDSGGRKGTGGRRERELVEVTDFFLGLGDVGLVLNVSS